ncbi:MAG TPA: EAL domain-containing protein [Acidimicrobiales bacterium]|nr:EAL domain-containing protein [Acidimicrobiales bacterium]
MIGQETHPRWFRLLALLAGLASGGFVVGTLLLRHSQSASAMFEHGAEGVAALLGAGACTLAAFRGTGRYERWMFLAASCATWVIGEAVWCFSNLATTTAATGGLTSSSDGWFVASVPLALIGLLMFPVPERRLVAGIQGVLDGILIAGSLIYASWVSVLAPIYSSHLVSWHVSLATHLLSPAYPSGDILLASFALIFAARAGSRMRSGLEWVMVAFVVFALSDIAVDHLTSVTGYSGVADQVLGVGRFGGFLLIGLGALWVLIPRQARVVDSERVTRTSYLAPYAPFVLAGAITLERILHHESLGLFTSLWGLALLMVLSARQILGFSDNLNLNHHLEARVKMSVSELRTREARFSALVQHSSDVVSVVDERGVVSFQSQSVERVLGWDPATSVGLSLPSMLHPSDQPRWSAVVERVMVSPNSEVVTEWKLRHADGSWKSFQSVVTNLLHEPSVRGLVLNSRDITDQKALEDQLRHQAFHDPLTGLANRALFAEHLEHAARRRIRSGTGLAVLFIDVDDFKAVNDLRGHAVADELLHKIAQRLSEVLRDADLIARLGGDEFAVLLETEPVDPHPLVVASRLIDAFSKPFEISSTQVHARVSIGVAIDDSGGESAQDLLRNADLAMYAAKIRGKGTYEVYSTEMHSVILNRMRTESDLRRALENEELVVYYQPIVDVASKRIIDLEALVRWRHGDGRLVPPGDFIDVAEASGLIVPLGAWVLERACLDMQRLFGRTELQGELGLSVNLSPKQLSDPNLLVTVREALEKGGMDAGRLTLEITESSIMQNTPRTCEVLAQLRGLGVKTAIDDFGTGYSSLASLRDIPLDVLKIDRTFVIDISHSEESVRLAKTILQLAEDFNLRTIAEGIEELDQLTTLEDLGCDSVQGYYLGKPMTAEDMARTLDRELLADVSA